MYSKHTVYIFSQQMRTECERKGEVKDYVIIFALKAMLTTRVMMRPGHSYLTMMLY